MTSNSDRTAAATLSVCFDTVDGLLSDMEKCEEDGVMLSQKYISEELSRMRAMLEAAVEEDQLAEDTYEDEAYVDHYGDELLWGSPLEQLELPFTNKKREII